MGKLHSALLEARKSYEPLRRDKVGRFGKYATLQSIHAAVHPALHAAGLLLTETIDLDGVLTIRVVNAEGEAHSSSMPVGTIADYEATKGLTEWQVYGRALTYARRYLTIILLGLSPDDLDDDGDGVNRRPQRPPTRQDSRPVATPPPNIPYIASSAPVGAPTAQSGSNLPIVSNGAPTPAAGLSAIDIGWLCKKAGVESSALSEYLKIVGYTSWAQYVKPRETLLVEYLQFAGRGAPEGGSNEAQ